MKPFRFDVLDIDVLLIRARSDLLFRIMTAVSVDEVLPLPVALDLVGDAILTDHAFSGQ